MDIATLLHEITLAGLSLRRGAGESLEVAGDVSRVTPAQRLALSEHKGTLLSLLPPLLFSEAEAEREAVAFADSPAPEATGLLAEAMRFFEVIADGYHVTPEPQAEPEPSHHNELLAAQKACGYAWPSTLEPGWWPEPCPRCNGRQTSLAVIHAGESLRRDCAHCGRFVDFPAWHSPATVEKLLRATEEANATMKQAAQATATLRRP